ncbi:MAG TPA: Xaa-Pro peptidase family protein [Candidatus Acidoferrum sp.]|jgi:Xaa-Pro aminopeptidase
MKMDFLGRRRQLAARMDGANLDCLLVTHPANWYYLTGFTGESGSLVVSRGRATLVTDGRFTAQAKEETSGVRIVPQKENLAQEVGKVLRAGRAKAVGFDQSQVTVGQFSLFKKAAGPRMRWVATAGQVEALRERKEAAELAEMRSAAILAGEVLEGALALLKPGVRELEVAAEIEYQMRKRGASGPAFETIVAFGERAAHPHARPTGRRLGKNEFVVLDLGAILAHYCSDITRTVFVGRASGRYRRWYKAVLEAQCAAIAAVKVGVTCGEVDAAARQVLAGYGLAEQFVHSTGHGLGLEVHEDPRIARGQKRKLLAGNAVTIEPGIYVPGVGGIRIEDDVVVHEDRTEVLTRIPRDLREI